ncbi:MAG: ferredoxin [Nitrososphaeria archaeon]|nr:ferredoxin [Nitrososphaeria archaeon]NIN53677.1 ferredoxin [Nitrososphaeria archaeon]NIQ34222.1 ferredoxin [Nitrososphaeria archaeon]
MKKPRVDRSICEGYQVCVGIAPDVFDINEEGKAYVKDPQGADEKTIEEAIMGCPTQAISWEEV